MHCIASTVTSHLAFTDKAAQFSACHLTDLNFSTGKPVDNQFNPSPEGTLGLLPKSTAPLLALLHNSSHPHQSICS